ncbi:hypothetical protein H0H93_005810 [Arthromyces matolae]|nr:hypothetical protein H0H93_005810 [Arthromyces matolae]
MSNDRFINSYNKHRSSPDHSQGFFQTGQGGRPVLPPISSFPTLCSTVPSYPTQCTPRSSPTRYEVNPQLLYQYSPEPATTYPVYDTHERYSNASQYNYASRTPPLASAHQIENRKLPQLSTNTGGWQTTSYMTNPPNYSNSGNIRSPTATYPNLYAYPPTTQGGNYTYLPQDHSHVPISSMNQATFNTDPYGYAEQPRGDNYRSSSPYGRSSSHTIPSSTTPPPISPTSQDESTVKKKRKRADARQLKVLNETYNRTAFPSTEERLALAKELDMTARSVQIWYEMSSDLDRLFIRDRFQNKRQSMRQTNRQSSAAGSSSSQPFIGGQDHLDEPPSIAYGSPMSPTDGQYSTRSPPEASRSPLFSQSSQRRVRHEEAEHRKWY